MRANLSDSFPGQGGTSRHRAGRTSQPTHPRNRRGYQLRIGSRRLEHRRRAFKHSQEPHRPFPRYISFIEGQSHLDAETYLSMMRAEIASYDELQSRLADTTAEVSARSILDLGSGTGETAIAVLKRHPEASLVGVDSSGEMRSIARRRLPSETFIVSRLEDPLPSGLFDVIVSAFAIHHLDGEQKAELFNRVASALSPGGRFAMLDVVVPSEPVEAPIRLEEGVDKPSSVHEMLRWIEAAGLEAELVYSSGDLAILAGGA